MQNHGQQRAKRSRLKQAKREAEEQKRRDAVLRRETGPDADAAMGFRTTGTESSQSRDGAEEVVLS